MIKNRARKATTYAFAAALTAGAAVTMVSPAHADDVEAQARHGCPYGAVCIYPQDNWNGGKPEHVYHSYGAHPLHEEYGVQRLFNNQYGGSTVSLCKGTDGTNCGTEMDPNTYADVDFTPFNTIRLNP